MKMVAFAWLTIAVALPALGQDYDIQEQLDRFNLWNDCRPIDLVIENLSDGAAEIGLELEDIEIAARSRMRSARLYTEEAPTPQSLEDYHRLYINVAVVGNAFNISIEYDKYVHHLPSDGANLATTWDTGGTGTHGQDANYIISTLSQYMDRFIDEYLRVNDSACD